jgi:hypothetical protein
MKAITAGMLFTAIVMWVLYLVDPTLFVRYVTATVPPGTMRRVSSTCDHDTCLDVWKDEGAHVCFLVAASRNGLAVTPMACPQ